MTYSKRRLYALGEPLGDCVTRREAGRIICGGGGGGGSSSSDASTTTNNTDMRVVGGNNSTNTSAHVGNGSAVTVNTVDAGAVAASFGFAKDVSAQAFNFASASQIDTSKTVASAMGQVAEAYSTAKAGEQKIFAGAALAVVGVVAVIGFSRR